MAKIILSTNYYRAGNVKGASNLVRYMATRPGVEKLEINSDRRPVTQKQDEMIRRAIKKFPEVYLYPEFNTFLEDKTRATAEELLAAVVERNIENEPDMSALVHYYAERPGVEKHGSHGLFSDTDEDIDLDKVADEVAHVHGIVFTDVISLRREDASRLGYDNAEAWKGCIRRNLNEIAQAHKINMSELKWYAAFHNTEHHPHVHLMVYSENGTGYITKKGYLDLKSALVNDIFRNEQYKLFKLQTDIRDELKQTYDEIIKRLVNAEVSDNMLRQFMDLRHDLSQCKGKMVYGYLPKRVKVKIDNLVKEIAKVPEIAELYAEWNRLNREKLSVYYDSRNDEDIPLEENDEFRSLKNQLISYVLKLSESISHTSQQGVDNTNKAVISDALSLFAYAMSIASSKRIDSLNGQIDLELRKREMEKRAAHGLKGTTENTKKENDEEASEIASGNVAAVIGIGIAAVDTAVRKLNKAETHEEEQEEETPWQTENEPTEEYYEEYEPYEEPEEEFHYYNDGLLSIGDSRKLLKIVGEDENGEYVIEEVGEMRFPYRAKLDDIKAELESYERTYYEDGTFSIGDAPEIWEKIGMDINHNDIVEFRGYIEGYEIETEDEDEGFFMSM